MGWHFKEGIPIYQQIMQMLKIGIVSGVYPPGSKMPAVRDLALEAGVNPNTMQRALAELERDGLLYSQRTSGRYVTEEAERLDGLKHALAGAYIGEMLEKMYALGFSDDQIMESVRRELK